jgi:hypothetical protein
MISVGRHRAACDDGPVSDEQPAGWAHPEQQPTPVPPGWARQQPPPYSSTGAVPGPPAGAPGGWQQPQGAQPAGAPGGWQQPQGYQPATGFPPPPPPPPKPGIIALRPLGVGEILDGSISAIRAHPRLMLGLSAVVAVIAQVLTVPVTWLLLRDSADGTFSFDQPANESTGGDVAFAASAITATAVQVAVTLVAALILTGILTVAVSRAVLGQSISARDAWDQARPRVPALLGATGLVLLIMLGLVVLSVAPGVLVLVAGGSDIAGGLTIALGVVVATVGAVYLYTSFALFPPVIVLERQSVMAALRRSRALVRGAWWRTFGILLLVNVIAQLIANILSVPFVALTFLVAYLTGDNLNVYALLPLIVTALGTIVASAVTWPFTAVATALVYVDRRMRREALDIELARAAGVAPAAAPPPRR